MLARYMGMLIAGLAICLLASQILDEIRFSRYVDLAGRITYGVTPDAGYWSVFDAGANGSTDVEDECNYDGIRAKLTVELAAFDSARYSQDLVLREKRRKLALASARQNVLCAPMDGNAWFRLAVLELLQNGPGKKLSTYFELSDRFAPAEGWIIQARAPLYAVLIEHGHPEFRASADRDMKAYAAFGNDPVRVMLWLGGWPDVFRESFMQALGFLTTRERNRYYAIAGNLGLNIGQPKIDVIVIDPFTGKPFNRNMHDRRL